MNNLEKAVYHAWLRQQLGVTDIQPNDFSEREAYFQHRISLAIDRPSEMVKNAYQAYINAVASQVAHDMDGTRINTYRQSTGKNYRRDVTQRFLDNILSGTEPKLWFNYHPYTGITSNIGSDWTSGYNGIEPMGHLTHHQSPEERNKSLYDTETGERWPENEIWPVQYGEALFHLLRTKQMDPSRPDWPTRCGDDNCNYRCKYETKATAVLDATWQEFLNWKQDRDEPQEPPPQEANNA